jgi:hypothetical protein
MRSPYYTSVLSLIFYGTAYACGPKEGESVFLKYFSDSDNVRACAYRCGQGTCLDAVILSDLLRSGVTKKVGKVVSLQLGKDGKLESINKTLNNTSCLSAEGPVSNDVKRFLDSRKVSPADVNVMESAVNANEAKLLQPLFQDKESLDAYFALDSLSKVATQASSEDGTINKTYSPEFVPVIITEAMREGFVAQAKSKFEADVSKYNILKKKAEEQLRKIQEVRNGSPDKSKNEHYDLRKLSHSYYLDDEKTISLFDWKYAIAPLFRSLDPSEKVRAESKRLENESTKNNLQDTQELARLTTLLGTIQSHSTLRRLKPDLQNRVKALKPTLGQYSQYVLLQKALNNFARDAGTAANKDYVLEQIVKEKADILPSSAGLYAALELYSSAIQELNCVSAPGYEPTNENATNASTAEGH